MPYEYFEKDTQDIKRYIHQIAESMKEANDLKERELQLKERELQLKERELDALRWQKKHA